MRCKKNECEYFYVAPFLNGVQETWMICGFMFVKLNYFSFSIILSNSENIHNQHEKTVYALINSKHFHEGVTDGQTVTQE